MGATLEWGALLMVENPVPLVDDPEWRKILLEGHRPMRVLRTVLRRVPSDPRCKVCNSPFGGAGGRVAGFIGFRPSAGNPAICSRCCDRLGPGGATVDLAVLFADVRGSTQLGEEMAPAMYAGRMRDFYRSAMGALLPHGAFIDKFVGDEVMALFLQGVAGADYRLEACRAALALQATVGPSNGAGGLPVGIGLHAGEAFVGNVSDSGITDFTALGDTVNTAARLQSHARPGELVMSEEIYTSIAHEHPDLARETIELRGKQEPFAVRVLRPG